MINQLHNHIVSWLYLQLHRYYIPRKKLGLYSRYPPFGMIPPNHFPSLLPVYLYIYLYNDIYIYICVCASPHKIHSITVYYITIKC